MHQPTDTSTVARHLYSQLPRKSDKRALVRSGAVQDRLTWNEKALGYLEHSKQSGGHRYRKGSAILPIYSIGSKRV